MPGRRRPLVEDDMFAVAAVLFRFIQFGHFSQYRKTGAKKPY
jgi:hypothetical protein